MARREQKKEKKVENSAVKEKDLGVKELRFELQKKLIEVRSGKEKNTSIIRKLKRDIARKLTLEKIKNGN